MHPQSVAILHFQGNNGLVCFLRGGVSQAVTKSHLIFQRIFFACLGWASLLYMQYLTELALPHMTSVSCAHLHIAFDYTTS